MVRYFRVLKWILRCRNIITIDYFADPLSKRDLLLPLNQAQVSVIGLDDPNPLANCDVVKANPVYGHMMSMAVNFMAQ